MTSFVFGCCPLILGLAEEWVWIWVFFIDLDERSAVRLDKRALARGSVSSKDNILNIRRR